MDKEGKRMFLPFAAPNYSTNDAPNNVIGPPEGTLEEAVEKCKSFVEREWRSWGYDPDCMWWAVLDLDTMAVHWDTGETTIPDGISGRESVPYGNKGTTTGIDGM